MHTTTQLSKATESMIWGHGGIFRRFQGDKQPNKKNSLGKNTYKVQSCQENIVEKTFINFFAWLTFNSMFNSYAKICFTNFCLICIFSLCIYVNDRYMCSSYKPSPDWDLFKDNSFENASSLFMILFHVCLLAVCTPFSNSCEDKYPETPLETNSGRPTRISDW